MVMNGLIDFGYGILAAMVGLLPVGDPETYAGVGTMVAQAMALNAVVPIGTAFACVLTVLAFNSARLLFWFAGWALKHIPVIG